MLEYMQDAAEAAQFTDAMGGERPGEDVAPKPSVLISRLPDPILEHIFGYLAQGRRRHQFSMCVENGVTAGSGVRGDRREPPKNPCRLYERDALTPRTLAGPDARCARGGGA